MVSSNSPKEGINKFVVVVKMHSFGRFLGEFEDINSPFEIFWPLVVKRLTFFSEFLLVSTLGDSWFFRLQGIKVFWRLQFLEYLSTLILKFQKARTKIEVVLSLPCWLSQFSRDIIYTLLNLFGILRPQSTWWNP